MSENPRKEKCSLLVVGGLASRKEAVIVVDFQITWTDDMSEVFHFVPKEFAFLHLECIAGFGEVRQNFIDIFDVLLEII